MDEIAFETFEEELVRRDAPPKPSRQIRRPDTQTLRRVKEDSTTAVPTPKDQGETSQGELLLCTVSAQGVSHEEAPWRTVTLNHCLLLAITMVLIGSGLQRLCEMLESWGAKTDTDVLVVQSLQLRHFGLKQGDSAQQADSYLWDTWLWNFIMDNENEDEDTTEDEEEEKSRGRIRIKEAEARGGRRGAGGLKRARKQREKRGREELRERVKGQRSRDRVSGKSVGVKHEEEDEEERGRLKRQKAEGQKQVRQKNALK